MLKKGCVTLPLTRDGKEWLNASEASEFLEVSFVTFQNMRELFGLRGRSFSGQGRQVFYWKEHLERVKNSSSDDESVKRVRSQIESEQSW